MRRPLAPSGKLNMLAEAGFGVWMTPGVDMIVMQIFWVGVGGGGGLSWR